MLKIDKKDDRILYELSRNSRLPLSKLAKKIGLSREVTHYRFKRLLEKGVILNFITDINEQKLGFSRYLIYFAFQCLDEEKEKAIIAYLVSHPFVSWTTTSTGKWSVILDFIARDHFQVNAFIDEMKKQYWSMIGDYLVASQISFAHFYSKYYHYKKEVLDKKRSATPLVLDKKDFQILHLLSSNSRYDYAALSKKVALTPNAIKRRVDALLESQIITSFCMHINKTLLSYVQYYLQLDFVNQTKEHEREIIAYVKQHPQMNAYYIPLGHWSIEIAVFVKDPGELRRIILGLRNKFGNHMRIHDTMLFYEEPKGNYLPEGVFL